MAPPESRILPGPRRDLRASVEVPSSKSLTNRALVLAAVAGGGRISAPLDCEDTRLLAEALRAAGWSVEWPGGVIEVGPRDPGVTGARLHLGNSGTGARLLLGLLAVTPGRWVVDGTPRLRERPMGPLVAALTGMGVPVRSAPGGHLPVEIRGGPVEGGVLHLAPGASSQFVSSLLLAAPLMRRGLELGLEGEVPSRPYLDLTRRCMEARGLELSVSEDGRTWRVPPGAPRPGGVTVEGDWSAVAFFVAAVAVAGGSLGITPLDLRSVQGDRAVLGLLEEAGLRWSAIAGGVRVEDRVVRPFRADLSDTPDLFPALAVVAAAAPPGSVLEGLEHLRHKESDRLGVMVENLRRCGARVEADGRSFRVTGSLGRLESPVAVRAAGDHRIAMAMAVAALATGPLELDDASCVGKSFPDFWKQWDRVTLG